MSYAIAKLLDKPEHLVESMVSKLEDLNGQTSEDVRLLADNLQKLRTKISQLGLDPNDTTAEELYHSLRVKFTQDSNQLDKALGIKDSDDIEIRVAKASQLVAAMGTLPEMWLLKHSATKTLLQQSPPKKLMKKLNYQSVQSLLKRENIDNVFLAAASLESDAWLSAISKKIAKLNSASFEVRKLHVTTLPANYHKNIDFHQSNVLADLRIGAVAAWQPNLPGDSTLLSIAVLIIGGLEELSGADLSNDFYALNPALRWWSDNSSLISTHDSETVSLNLKDIAQDSMHNYDYSQRTRQHGAKALFSTLLSRYQNQSERVASTIKDIGYNLNSSSNTLSGVPSGAQLAPEYEVAA